MPPASAVPASGTSAHDTAQTTPSAASVAIRRRPSSARATGSCASTITTVLRKNATPIPFSLTPAKFFAYAGKVSSPAMPAVTNTKLTPSTAMNTRLRSTSA